MKGRDHGSQLPDDRVPLRELAPKVGNLLVACVGHVDVSSHYTPFVTPIRMGSQVVT